MEFNCLIVILFSILVSASGRTLSGDADEDISQSLNRARRELPDNKVKPPTNVVILPTYSVYLIGFTMFFMFIAIIGLAVALYFALKNKRTFGISANNTQYVRQESGVTQLYNSNYDEPNKNNGSTLTMNSGIIEISEPRVSDPGTPTRLEDSKIVYTKKPINVNPNVPLMPRVQMDAICKEVLRRVQKSDSASFRDLNEIMNFKNEEKIENKCDIVEESEKEVKKEEKVESKIESKIEPEQSKPDTELKTTAEPQNETKMEEQNEVKEETTNKPTNEIEIELKPEIKTDEQIELPKENFDKPPDVSDTDTEYDTVPNAIRYRHSGSQVEIYNPDGFPLYDLPPRRSHDGPLRNVIQMDQDSQYLLALSRENLESCYVNAKNPPSK